MGTETDIVIIRNAHESFSSHKKSSCLCTSQELSATFKFACKTSTIFSITAIFGTTNVNTLKFILVQS